MQSYEVEVKSLLGTPENANNLRLALAKLDPSCKLERRSKQLNHYFEGGTLASLAKGIAPHLSSGVIEIRLDDLVERATDFSVRSRESIHADGSSLVYFVVKASVGSDTSANGVARIELEEKVALSLDELDRLILSAGFQYQAKWSREREEYLCNGVAVTLDKNAGYGWLAEFERIVDDPTKVDGARDEIRALMSDLGVEELPQERLERMFSFYNTHWQEYYGTEKIFTVN